MTLVIDASVALKWFVEEQGSDRARGLLSREERLIAPELLLAEVFNAAWRLLRGGHMVAEQYDIVLARLAGAIAEFVPLRPIVSRAAAIGRALDHPIYDCFYLAVAERASAALVTADRRFLNRIAGSPWQPVVQDLYGLAPGT